MTIINHIANTNKSDTIYHLLQTVNNTFTNIKCNLISTKETEKVIKYL